MWQIRKPDDADRLQKCQQRRAEDAADAVLTAKVGGDLFLVPAAQQRDQLRDRLAEGQIDQADQHGGTEDDHPDPQKQGALVRLLQPFAQRFNQFFHTASQSSLFPQ